MTGFERFAVENGFKLTHGSLKPYNTYDNCNRRYEDSKGNAFIIGLYAKPTRIGIINPIIKIDDKYMTSLPTEEMFNFVLNEIKYK